MENPEFSSFFHKIVINSLLGHVRNIFCKCHLHNASKKVFQSKILLNSMLGFKSAILPELKNCQNGTFEPVHGIQIFFWPKDFFEVT